MNRVVVTGMGIVSPLGCNVDSVFNNLMNGKSNFLISDQLKREYPEGKKRTSNVSSDFEDLCKSFGIQPVRNFSNYVKLAVLQAVKDAGLSNDDIDCDLFIGTCESATFERGGYFKTPINEIENYLEGEKPVDKIAELAFYMGVKGEVLSFPIACTGGNIAITVGAKKIMYGNSKMCIVGGADFLTDKIYSTFYNLGSLAKTHCKPFDKSRDGIVVGEGAAFIIIEDLMHALNRSANVYAEIKGFNISCDAHHLTTPDNEGKMASISIEKALRKAHIHPKDISYISPHATGTVANDLQEANALIRVFGKKISTIPISAIKSLLGHCMGAASAIEAIAIIKSIQTGEIPQTINSNDPDTDFLYPLMLRDFPPISVNTVLSNSYAFGGNICSVIFSKI
jgi:3-oxoacyl-[acyl-carrier-protein] synthase II